MIGTSLARYVRYLCPVVFLLLSPPIKGERNGRKGPFFLFSCPVHVGSGRLAAGHDAAATALLSACRTRHSSCQLCTKKDEESERTKKKNEKKREIVLGWGKNPFISSSSRSSSSSFRLCVTLSRWLVISKMIFSSRNRVECSEKWGVKKIWKIILYNGHHFSTCALIVESVGKIEKIAESVVDHPNDRRKKNRGGGGYKTWAPVFTLEIEKSLIGWLEESADWVFFTGFLEHERDRAAQVEKFFEKLGKTQTFIQTGHKGKLSSDFPLTWKDSIEFVGKVVWIYKSEEEIIIQKYWWKQSKKNDLRPEFRPGETRSW